MFINVTLNALYVSISATILTLLIFGYFKAKLLGTPAPLFSALQMAIVGAAAAGCAFGIAKAIPQPDLTPRH